VIEEQPHVTRRRSGAFAATLSFIFPGLGQGYLRQLGAALLFGVPVLLLLLFVAIQLSDGIGSAALRLLNPTVAFIVGLVILPFGVWRMLSVLHAWREGDHSRAGRVVTVALVATILVTHLFGSAYVWSFMDAGERIFAGDSSDILVPDPFDEQPIDEEPTLTPTEPAPTEPGATPSPTAPPTPMPTDSDEPPDVQVPDVEEPAIVPGSTGYIGPAELLDGAEDGLLNVMLVGIDWTEGRDHRLTDTMIVVSVNTDTGDVFMFSFPRDTAQFPLYDGGTYTGRLNTFANYAERHPARYPNGGLRALSRQLGFMLGVPIDNYAAINLPGFQRVLRIVGGVTVNNPTAINDSSFGFFLDAGRHHLKPADAMRYVRSRKGPGNSDFLRARRQQEVLAALRQEILRPGRLVDLPAIVDAISETVSTDFPPDQIEQVIRLADLVSEEPTGSWVFGNPHWATHPPLSETDGRWIIVPNMKEIKKLSRELFGDKSLYSR
jgi:LCP family protein required for cell wall assembly